MVLQLHIKSFDRIDALAEGVAGGIYKDTITVPLAQSFVDFVIECTKEKITSSIKSLAHEEHMLVEGSTAIALASFNKVTAELDG